MAHSARVPDYLGGGLAADRPATLDLAPGCIGHYWAEDTEQLSVWWDGAWHEVAGGGASAAADVAYDNAASGLAAENAQAAIDELVAAIDAIVSPAVTESIIIACSDETTALTTGAGKVTFRMPYAFTLSAVRASLTTAQTSGSILTVDINEAGASILSTKLTIDNTEKTSTTAATAAVISDTALADDAEITIDIDQVGDGTAKGLKVYLIGSKA